MKPASRWLRRSMGALPSMWLTSVWAKPAERFLVLRWVRSNRMSLTPRSRVRLAFMYQSSRLTKRVARFPDLPTLSEEGLPDFEALLWLGLIAPANTAQPIVQKVNAIINDMLGRPKEQELLANQAIYAAPMSPAEMRQMVEKEISKWKAVSQEDRRSK